MHSTPAQVLFRALLNANITPLSGTTSVEHMRDDVNVVDIVFNPDEQLQIEALFNNES